MLAPEWEFRGRVTKEGPSLLNLRIREIYDLLARPYSGNVRASGRAAHEKQEVTFS